MATTLELERFEVNEAGIRAMLTSGQAMEFWARCGDQVTRAAQSNCPVLTGRLRASIHSEITTGGPEVVDVRVGSDVEYAHFQEMNNRTHRGFLRGALATVGGAHAIEGSP